MFRLILMVEGGKQLSRNTLYNLVDSKLKISKLLLKGNSEQLKDYLIVNKVKWNIKDFDLLEEDNTIQVAEMMGIALNKALLTEDLFRADDKTQLLYTLNKLVKLVKYEEEQQNKGSNEFYK